MAAQLMALVVLGPRVAGYDGFGGSRIGIVIGELLI